MVISDYKDKKKKLICPKKKNKLDIKIISVCHANDTNIQMKDFPVDLILNWWVLETWK